jgi:hypothetical protein
MGATYQADQFPGSDFGAKVAACLNALSASYGGTCDARNFTGNLSMASNLTISISNAAILLPCATIATANQVVVTAGTRNVSLRGCALRGGTAASGSQGGTVFAYSGTSAMVEVGDSTYAADTPGFHMDNVAINTTAAASATAQGMVAYRTQEIDLESLYFLGNQNQTGITLDGTGNYTGGTFLDNQFTGFGTAVNAIGTSGCERGHDGLDECQHIRAVAHRLPDGEWESYQRDIRYQLTAGRRKHIYGRRRRGMRDGPAPGNKRAEQHDRGTAQRELDQPNCGGCRQRVQQLANRRDHVWRPVD